MSDCSAHVEDEPAVRVVIHSDRRSASLHIPAAFPREAITASYCRLLLSEANVEITEAVAAAVRRLADDPPSDEGDAEIVVARATDPTPGKDGSVRWLVQREGEEEPAPDDPVCFYQRSAYVMVEEGDRLAQIIDPEPAVDGRDVTGRPICARSGRPVALTYDDSIIRDSHNYLVAQIAGVMIHQGDKVRIAQRLEINGYVDFATGNIDFDGEIKINGGVRDRFVVVATGGIQVAKLVEAAVIECGSDLLLAGGMAGRERGTLTIGGSLIARYLDSVDATIADDLRLERECMSCALTIGGSIVAPRASIIGGHVTLARSGEIATIGSPAHVPTRLVLASIPKLEQARARSRDLLTRMHQLHSRLEQEQHELSLAPRFTPAQRERQTELAFELARLPQQIERCREAESRLTQQLAEQTTVALTIHRKLFAGVTFEVAGQPLLVRDDLPGPVHITRSSDGQLLCTVGRRSPVPLVDVVSCSQAA